MTKFAALEADLLEMDNQMRRATARLKGAPVIVSHPVYHYWERAYGLEVASLLWEPEMDLDDTAMADLGKIMETHPGARYFVWEGTPLPEHIEKLKSVGLTSIVIAPGGNQPALGDFAALMNGNIGTLDSLPE